MNNQEQKQATSGNDYFSLVWNGGFSYLTYLKKKSTVAISSDRLTIQTQNFILGAFPGRAKSSEHPYSAINGVSVGSKINWFDMVFAILFAVVTLVTMTFWPLLLTIIFLLCTFNTAVSITDKQGNRINILSGSKKAAIQFVENATLKINQHRETALSESNPTNVLLSPITPVKETNKKKTTFLIVSAAVVALLVLTVAILSRGGSENEYVHWVKEGAVPGSNLKMAQVLENPAYFSNIEWKEVQEEGNTLDKFVMYQSTLSDQGVKVSVRTIFEVFGENHFEAVETSADGEILHLSDWYVFLADMTDKYNNSNSPKEIVQSKEPEQLESSAIQQSSTPEIEENQPISDTTTALRNQNSLANFTRWSPSEPDVTLPLEFDGENVDLLIGQDTPNGVKAIALSTSLGQEWPLQMQTNPDGGTPFDEFGDLKEGFSIYMNPHDFGGDGVPEIVVAASDGLLETYVWVFAYNFIFTEYETTPLDLIWHGEGQSDVILEDNKILLPFGSQGLFDEYVYSDNTFAKQ